MSDPLGRVVYTLTTSEALNNDEWSREVVTAFLRAHGLDPNRFMIGNPVYVVRQPDDTYIVRTWQAVEGLPLCEACPSCVAQERVDVPLVHMPPVVGPPHSYLSDSFAWTPGGRS